MIARKTLAVATVVVTAGWLFTFHTDDQLRADDKVVQIPSTAEGSASASEKAVLMQTKLKASSTVLDGLVNGDFAKIRRAAELLEKVAEASPRRYKDLEEMRVYEHFRDEFIRESGRLQRMANDRNLEGAAYVHQNLTSTCIACHLHVRERIAPPLSR